MARQRIRVALVDDDSSVRKALGRLLRAASFDVETYGSGAELLESIDSSQPSCILLDLHLQGMSGLDVQRHLHRVGSRTPVIVMTGHGSSKERKDSFKLGASAFLAKPIDDNVLIASIKQAVSVAKA